MRYHDFKFLDSKNRPRFKMCNNQNFIQSCGTFYPKAMTKSKFPHRELEFFYACL